jgi:hypothetical protein
MNDQLRKWIVNGLRGLTVVALLVLIMLAWPGGGGPDWEPDPSMLPRLDLTIHLIDGYQIRPPRDWQHQDSPGDDSFERVWIAPDDKGKTAEEYTFRVLISPPLTTAELRKNICDQMIKHRDEMSQPRVFRRFTGDEPERGRINGISFVRMKWEAVRVRKEGELTYRGFSLIGQEGERRIGIFAMCAGPESEANLKIMDAAALTFKRSTRR